MGAAYRVPFGDLTEEPALRELSPGGAVPTGFARWGIGTDADLGLEVAGAAARAMLRGQVGLGTVRLVGGVAPHAGLAHGDGELARVGGTVPVTLAVDVLSLYELWIGVRVGLEHLTGRAAGAAISATGLRTGGVIGLALGFRRLSFLVELGVDHELWTGTVADINITRSGLVLTPAIAARLRL